MSGIEGIGKPKGSPERAKKKTEETIEPSYVDRIATALDSDTGVQEEQEAEIYPLSTHEQDNIPPPIPHAPPEKWSDKKVEKGAVNIRTLPINWNALTALGKSVNRLADDRVSREDLANLKPPAELYAGIPMVMSVVAHHRNKEIPIQLPTKEDVGRMKPYVRELYYYIRNLVSHKLADKFNNYIEREGERVVLKTGLKIADIADVIGSIENPRQQMLNEVALLYRHLQKPQVAEGVFWDDEVSIEDKIHNFLYALKEVKRDPAAFSEKAHKDLPILLNILPKLNLPSDEFDTWSASIAGAELMQGLERFLRQQGIADIEPAPQPQEFDLFDFSSWPRGFAEAFAGEKLERVKNDLPTILDQALAVLPENGPECAKQIYDLAESVCVLHAQGTHAPELAQHIFTKTK